MATRSSTQDSDVWCLDAEKAFLDTPQLTACIDLLNPHAGLSRLTLLGQPIEGFVLGVFFGAHVAVPNEELADVFVRGDDLIVTYGKTDERPFSLQVYWRATVREQGVLLLDTILSLQTDLLESFPDLAVETRLPASTAWLLADEEAAATEIAIPCDLPSDRVDGLFLKPSRGDWSYAEATHPEDRGASQIARCDDKLLLLEHRLGGRFLEKGVIRCLRVRGVFLPQEPQEKSIELATQSLASLATEEPPLTV